MTADPGLAATLERELDRIRPFIASHFGGVEVDTLDASGNVHVRFTGACEGCLLQPVTFASRVEPTLKAIPGVSSVTMDGRISPHAMRRIRKYFAA